MRIPKPNRFPERNSREIKRRTGGYRGSGIGEVVKCPAQARSIKPEVIYGFLVFCSNRRVHRLEEERRERNEAEELLEAKMYGRGPK